MVKAFDVATKVCERIQKAGYQAVFTGGCVRDMLLGREPKDIDIATDAIPCAVEKLFVHTKSVGEAFGVVLVPRSGHTFEVATFRQDSLSSDGRHPDSVEYSSMEEDAKRRDFTCNALFFDPISKELFDFVGGKKDIEDKVLRFVGDPVMRLREDQLRALRAVRFVAQLGFKLDYFSQDALRNANLDKLSLERIKMEVDKMLLTSKPSRAFDLMERTGLLAKALPEVQPLVTSYHNPEFHPEGNPWRHTLIVLDTVRNRSSNLAVLWGALLHDVGKPAAEVWENGKVTNHGHDEIGATIAVSLLRRLMCSNELIDEVEFLVYNHMRIKLAKEMRKAKLRRLLSSPFAQNLVTLSVADSIASPVEGRLDWIDFDLTEVGRNLPEPLVSGKDLMAMGMNPGPKMGELLRKISDMQLDEVLLTRDIALEFAKEHLND